MTNEMELMPEAATEMETVTVQLSELPPNEVMISPEPTKALIAMMAKHGLLQRVILKAPLIDSLNQSDMSQHAQYGDPEDSLYTVIEGRRRIKAARALGWTEIDAIVLTFPESDYSTEISVQVHGTRDYNPGTEAIGIKEMIASGLDERAISKLTGMAPPTIKRRMALIALSPAIWDGFINGKVAITVAESIAKLPQSVQDTLCEVLAAKGTITAQDIKEAREARRSAAAAQLPADLFDVPEVEDGQPPVVLEKGQLVTVYEVLRWALGKGTKGAPRALRQKMDSLLDVVTPAATGSSRW